MAKTRQRGTGVRVRSEAKAALADQLLYEAQQHREAYEECDAMYRATPKWRWRRRRAIRLNAFLAAIRHLKSITAAQEIAKKGRYADIG